MEISTLLIGDVASSGFIANTMVIRIPKITAPTTLKDRWMAAARFAVRCAPTLDKIAVIQVPIF